MPQSVEKAFTEIIEQSGKVDDAKKYISQMKKLFKY